MHHKSAVASPAACSILGGRWRCLHCLQQRADDREPFVLYLPLSLPHPPYACPQPYHDMCDPVDVPPLRPAEPPNKPDFHRLIREGRRLGEVSD